MAVEGDNQGEDTEVNDANALAKTYTEALNKTVLERAQQLAGTGRIDRWGVDKAFHEYASGRPIREIDAIRLTNPEKGDPPEKSWWDGLLHSINGVTIISAILAVVFGVLALTGVGPAGTGGNASGFLDIAKIFAGAIVGSTAAEVRSRHP